MPRPPRVNRVDSLCRQMKAKEVVIKNENRFLLSTVVLLLSITSIVVGQTPQPDQPLKLDEVVALALRNYPAARAAQERLAAANANVQAARTVYLPRTDLLWQSNRATHNNIAGLLLPQAIIPPISGPVLPTTSSSGVWGSAGGALLSWEPLDFGLHAATVGVARSAQDTASSQLDLTRLSVAAAAADAFLTVVVAQQTRQAAQADVDRRQVFANSVHVLVDKQLRPGVDASRADAELAAARNGLIRAQQAEDNSRIALAQALGIAGTSVQIQPGNLATSLPSPQVPSSAVSQHPSAQVANKAIAEVRAREHALDRSYFPRFNFQSAFSGRGSGARPNGTVGSGTDGLATNRNNWAVGLTATFPVFDIFSIRSRKQVEMANERASMDQYDQVVQDLTGQLQRAQIGLDSAQRVAANTAVELQSAQLTNQQAEARYRAGLATLIEVADAQRLLVQAESDNAVATLSVWRALLLVSFAQGNL